MRGKKNLISNKPHLIHLTIFLFLHSTTSMPISTPSFCGKIQIRPPFLGNTRQSPPPPFNVNSTDRLLSRMLLCKSHKLYLRTSIGLFQVTSIDYNAKLLTVYHQTTPLSTTQNFIPPSLISAGFLSPPNPNSLILVNCSHLNVPSKFPIVHNCKVKGSSCSLVDSEKLEVGFDPKDLNCSHYMRVYRRLEAKHRDNDGDNVNYYDGDNYEVGTKMSFEIPDHVPNVCDECKKPHGNCGVGLRCICHAKECRDKVVNGGGWMNQPSVGSIVLTVVIITFSFDLIIF